MVSGLARQSSQHGGNYMENKYYGYMPQNCSLKIAAHNFLSVISLLVFLLPKRWVPSY